MKWRVPLPWFESTQLNRGVLSPIGRAAEHRSLRSPVLCMEVDGIRQARCGWGRENTRRVWDPIHKEPRCRKSRLFFLFYFDF